jgi:hypothetical protein
LYPFEPLYVRPHFDIKSMQAAPLESCICGVQQERNNMWSRELTFFSRRNPSEAITLSQQTQQTPGSKL